MFWAVIVAYEPLTITDARWGEKRYDYDPNGQITRTRYGDGGAERFAYSPDLNIAATGADTERFLNWQTSAAGVVRIAHGPRGEVVTLEHDACGRVIRRTVTRKGFRPQTWVFEWNAQDQLVAADGPQGRWRYGYDPFGRRIFKEHRGQREVFLWDGDVLARSGDIDWFHEPDSFRPMARRQAGALFHIVNDHLGTPKEMFSEGGALAWSVDHDTWGAVRHVGSRPVERGDYWVETVPMIWARPDLRWWRNFARSGSRGNGRTRRAGSITTGSGIMSRWRGSMRARIRLG